MKSRRAVSTSILISIVVLLGACSSSKTKQSDTDVIPHSTDAETDSLPALAADSLPPPAAESSPPPAAESPPPSNLTETTSVSEPPRGATENYTVLQGDTLMKIAFVTLGDVLKWKEIYNKNKDQLKNPNVIPAGAVLKITKPATAFSHEHNGEKYLIKTGDTLGKISNTLYGTQEKWKEIWENNKQMIHDPNTIFAGFYLYYVPNGAVGSASGSGSPLVGGSESVSPISSSNAVPSGPEASAPPLPTSDTPTLTTK